MDTLEGKLGVELSANHLEVSVLFLHSYLRDIPLGLRLLTQQE
jgi:hypothetical protein